MLGAWTCLLPLPAPDPEAAPLGWAAWLIEFNNSLVAWMPHRQAAVQQLLQPLEAPAAGNGFGWLALVLLLLLGLLVIALGLVALARVALLNILLATAPLFLLGWVLPQTRALAGHWVRTFLLAVYLQVVQVLVLSLALATLAPVATGQDGSLLRPLLGVATLLLLVRLPRELAVTVGAATRQVLGLAALPLAARLIRWR